MFRYIPVTSAAHEITSPAPDTTRAITVPSVMPQNPF